jgi:hypothetical protein
MKTQRNSILIWKRKWVCDFVFCLSGWPEVGLLSCTQSLRSLQGIFAVLWNDWHVEHLVLHFTFAQNLLFERSGRVHCFCGADFSEQLSWSRTAATLGDSWVFSIGTTHTKICLCLVRQSHWFVKCLRSKGFIELFRFIFCGWWVRFLRHGLFLFKLGTCKLSWLWACGF